MNITIDTGKLHERFKTKRPKDQETQKKNVTAADNSDEEKKNEVKKDEQQVTEAASEESTKGPMTEATGCQNSLAKKIEMEKKAFKGPTIDEKVEGIRH